MQDLRFSWQWRFKSQPLGFVPLNSNVVVCQLFRGPCCLHLHSFSIYVQLFCYLLSRDWTIILIIWVTCFHIKSLLEVLGWLDLAFPVISSLPSWQNLTHTESCVLFMLPLQKLLATFCKRQWHFSTFSLKNIMFILCYNNLSCTCLTNTYNDLS
jgi:hypothetical protein